jgi:hypothetical protein
MLSLLLITALAVQYPPPASKSATDTSATKRATATTRSQQTAPKDAVSRLAFHDRMRELWNDHIVYTRNFIVSAAAGVADTAEVTQRLLRNQDEIGEAIKPYYGDAAGSQLASLLRNHIQLAAKTVGVAKGNTTQTSMNVPMNMQDTTVQNLPPSNRAENRMADTTKMRTNRDTVQIKSNSQYPTDAGRLNDTTKARAGTDTTRAKQQIQQGQYPTARADQGVVQKGEYVQNAQLTDSTALNQAIAALRANGDSIATLLSTANPRGFARTTMQGAIQMHLNLLLQEATAHLKRDWSGSIAAFDQSVDQALQMADMLSEGIMKQFPSRFTTKATTVSSLQ